MEAQETIARAHKILRLGDHTLSNDILWVISSDQQYIEIPRVALMAQLPDSMLGALSRQAENMAGGQDLTGAFTVETPGNVLEAVATALRGETLTLSQSISLLGSPGEFLIIPEAWVTKHAHADFKKWDAIPAHDAYVKSVQNEYATQCSAYFWADSPHSLPQKNRIILTQRAAARRFQSLLKEIAHGPLGFSRHGHPPSERCAILNTMSPCPRRILEEKGYLGARIEWRRTLPRSVDNLSSQDTEKLGQNFSGNFTIQFHIAPPIVGAIKQASE